MKKTKKAKNVRKVVRKVVRKSKTKSTAKAKRVSKKRSDVKLSPEGEQWLAAAQVEYNSKQVALNRDWGFGSFERWAFDPVTKTFSLHFADGTQVEADGQVLGTYCPGDGTWEWAWNNPNVEPQTAVGADMLKEVGTSLGISYLTVGKVPVPNREFAAYLCAIGVKATGAIGAHLGGDAPVEAAIVIYNPRRKLKAA